MGELEDPEKTLCALMESLPSSLKSLTVRMCGPEVGCDAYITSKELEDGRTLRQDVRPGLYHEVCADEHADLVVAMNAGIGVPQYARMWFPTLELLSKRPQRLLFAITSYTSGELLREERMLRERWSDTYTLEKFPALKKG